MQQNVQSGADQARHLTYWSAPREPWDIRDAAVVMPRVVTTGTYRPAEQFDVWKTRMREATDLALPDDADPARGFTVEALACNLTDIKLTAGRYDAHSIRRASRPRYGAPIDHWWLMYLRSGEAWFETGERRFHARPGAMFLISLDDDFHGRFTDCTGVCLTLPRHAFVAEAGHFDRVCTTILTGNLTGLLADHLASLEARVVGMSPHELRQAGRATAAVIAACIQPAAGRLELAYGSLDSALFERARRYIEQHLTEFDLDPERVAQGLRVSRSSLYRAFESVGGVARFILRRRLHAAHAELVADASSQIQEIAYRQGFGIGSEFARAFRREYGYSPREARQRAHR